MMLWKLESVIKNTSRKEGGNDEEMKIMRRKTENMGTENKKATGRYQFP